MQTMFVSSDTATLDCERILMSIPSHIFWPTFAEQKGGVPIMFRNANDEYGGGSGDAPVRKETDQAGNEVICLDL